MTNSTRNTYISFNPPNTSLLLMNLNSLNMADYGERLKALLSSALNDPIGIRSSAQAISRVDYDRSPCKPKNNAPEINRKDSGAEYVIDKNGEILKFKIAAVWNRKGMFDKTDTPYFNASSTKDFEKRVDRIRATMELQPLHPNDQYFDVYPAGAIKASNAAVLALLSIEQKLHEKRSSLVAERNHTTFVRSIHNEDRYVLVSTSHLLLPGLKGSTDTIPKLSP